MCLLVKPALLTQGLEPLIRHHRCRNTSYHHSVSQCPPVSAGSMKSAGMLQQNKRLLYEHYTYMYTKLEMNCSRRQGDIILLQVYRSDFQLYKNNTKAACLYFYTKTEGKPNIIFHKFQNILILAKGFCFN